MRPLLALLFAALAIAARLPFLVTGKIPFDSDEAVEGLMARHVLDGELPAFFWGQAYKGVPEVYASAAAFSLFGSSVTVLKSVTLVFFAAYVAVNFILLDRLLSRWAALSASLLLIAAPPSLVLWSLSASADYVIVMLLGTALLILVERAKSREQRAKPGWLFRISLIVGLGLWVHQLFIVYVIPLGIAHVMRRESWKRIDPRTLNKFALGIGVVAAIYVALGIVAFVSGGFAVQLGSIAISATAPQKMWRIAIGVLALAVLVQLAAATSPARARDVLRRYWPAAAGFLIGYAPVLIYSVLVEPARSPARVANAQQLVNAAPDIFGNIVPILAGFKIATTERLSVPLIAIVPGAAALAAYLWSSRRRLTTDFFALFVIFYPLLFPASGAYVDTQSYRYFSPWYAGLTVAWARGSLVLARERKTIAGIIVAAIVGVHIWQQVLWYRKLQPDMQSLATIECLKRNGIRGGYAEYWTAYKLTFLTQEAIVIAPLDGVDRYPKYSDFVRSLPPEARIDDAARCH